MSEDDGLPCQLCTQCATKLDNAINFKNLCEKSDLLFRQYTTEKIADSLSNHAYIKQEMSAENPYDVSNMEISGDYDDFLIFKTEPEVQLNEAKPVFKLDDVKDEIGTHKTHPFFFYYGENLQSRNCHYKVVICELIFVHS